MTQERIAVVDGLRSAFAKSWTTLNGLDAVGLSTHITRELLFRNDIELNSVDHIVWGTVISVPTAPNIAREIALDLGMYRTPGYTVTRACATGFEAVASAANMIRLGEAEIVVAGGVDITSNAPVPHKKEVIDKLKDLPKAPLGKKLQTLASMSPKDLLPNPPSISERYTGKTMGAHAEDMAKYFAISRQEQEEFAMASHKKAHAAIESEKIAPQIAPVFHKGSEVKFDNIVRPTMDPAKLQKMRPAFDRKNGTITAATSSALTDGASCVLLMTESKAKALGLKPLGYVRSHYFAALDPRENMLLGNVYSVPFALERAGLKLQDMDLVEIHEAFAAQVLSNLKCFTDKKFFEEKLNRSEILGEIDSSKLNIWGGSLAYGHPFAATGGRVLLNLLHGLKDTGGQFALGTICAAGGMGTAMVIERE